MKVCGVLAVVIVSAILLAGPSAALYGSKSPVIQATSKSFKALVERPGVVSMVEFYAPWCGHCKALAPAWEKAAKFFSNGMVQMIAVNCDDERSLCSQHGVQGFPTVKTILDGVESDYNGARAAGAITKAGLAMLHHKNLKTLADEAAVKAMMSDGKGIRVLFVSDKKSPTATHKALSMRHPNGQFYYVSSPSALAALGEVSAPSMLVFAEGAEEGAAYEGKMEFGEMEAHLEALFPAADSAGKRAKPKKSAPKEEAVEEVRGVVHLTSAEQWKEECLSQRRLCVVAFAEVGLEGEEVEETTAALKVLAAVEEKNHKAFRFFWTSGIKNEALLRALRVSDMLPGMGVFSPRKGVATSFVGAFEAEPISTFLGKVLRGSVRASPVKKGLMESIAIAA